MDSKTLIKANEIKGDIKELESILYYAEVYKERRKQFDYRFRDESGNKSVKELDPKHTSFILEAIQKRINELTNEFEKL